MTKPFELDPLLARDTVALGDWPLCRLLLMNDATYPWLILVPRRADLVELHDLTDGEASTLAGEVSRASRTLQAAVGADKMNVAALGNVCRQLHLHVIARFHGDPAWPRPVWNAVPARPYDAASLAARRAQLQGLGV